MSESTTTNLIKSVQSLKSLSGTMQPSSSSKNFNHVTPKNIKLKFMKIGGTGSLIGDKKGKVNVSLQVANQKPKIDLVGHQSQHSADLTNLSTPQHGLKLSKGQQSQSIIGLGSKFATASHKRLPTAKNSSSTNFFSSKSQAGKTAVQTSGAKTKGARILDHFGGDEDDQNLQDLFAKKGPQRTLKHQNSLPEGQMANKVPVTVSKQRLHGLKQAPTIKTGNLNSNPTMKTKF